MRFVSRAALALAGLGVACTFLPSIASADTFTFTNNAGDSNWNNGINWLNLTTNTTGAVPRAADAATIAGWDVVKATGNLTVAGLSLTGNVLTLGGAAGGIDTRITSATVAGGRIAVKGEGGRLHGAFAFSGRNAAVIMDVFDDAGSLEIAADASLTGSIVGLVALGGKASALTNNGSVAAGGAGIVTTIGADSVANNGTFRAANGAGLRFYEVRTG